MSNYFGLWKGGKGFDLARKKITFPDNALFYTRQIMSFDGDILQKE